MKALLAALAHFINHSVFDSEGFVARQRHDRTIHYSHRLRHQHLISALAMQIYTRQEQLLHKTITFSKLALIVTKQPASLKQVHYLRIGDVCGSSPAS